MDYKPLDIGNFGDAWLEQKSPVLLLVSLIYLSLFSALPLECYECIVGVDDDKARLAKWEKECIPATTGCLKALNASGCTQSQALLAGCATAALQRFCGKPPHMDPIKGGCSDKSITYNCNTLSSQITLSLSKTTWISWALFAPARLGFLTFRGQSHLRFCKRAYSAEDCRPLT